VTAQRATRADPLVALESELKRRAGVSTAAALYRLGHRADPLGFVPRDVCTWRHRWDDPRQEYRTLYCARSPATCLREALADLRPSAKTIAELQALYGGDADPRGAFGVVSREWVRSHALVAAEPWVDGPLVDIDDLEVRATLLRRHAALVAGHGMDHLDTTEVCGRVRAITQAISRTLWEDGAAGIRYRSNLDNRPCVALFEGRAGLYPIGYGTTFGPRSLQVIARKYNLQINVQSAPDELAAYEAPPTDKRAGPDRRQSTAPYHGPERRSGVDRRASV